METWLTVYTTIIQHEGFYGYSYYYKHDVDRNDRYSRDDHKSYTGVFAKGIKDRTHAELAAIGAALIDAKGRLKDYQLKGITIYTDQHMALSTIQEWVDKGHISTSDKNLSYVIGLNSTFKSLKCKRIYPRKSSIEPQDWLKTAIYRKIYKIIEIRKKKAKEYWEQRKKKV